MNAHVRIGLTELSTAPTDCRALAEAAAARADKAESDLHNLRVELHNIRVALNGDDARQALADGLRRLRGSSNTVQAGLADAEDAEALLADLCAVVLHPHATAAKPPRPHPPVDQGDQDMPCP